MKYFINIIMLSIVVIINSCTPPRVQHESSAGTVLAGEHELRRLTANTYSEHKASGSFFLFMGDYSSKTKQGIRVIFSWKLNDGTYAINSMPIEKIRVRLDKNNTSPSIKFKWLARNSKDLQYLMDHYVLYAIITCKNEDWPQKVDINTLP